MQQRGGTLRIGCAATSPGLLKSTLGGAAIAFSFSTEKLAFACSIRIP